MIKSKHFFAGKLFFLKKGLFRLLCKRQAAGSVAYPMMITALFHSLCESVCSMFRRRGKAPDTTPQQRVRIASYLGRWYEQARYDCFFERDMDEVYTDYTQREDGSIDILNSGTTSAGKRKEARGRAFVADAEHPGCLRVSFVPPYRWFRASYHILYVDEDYRMALVSGAGRGYLWLLTREHKADDATMRQLLNEATSRGFDINALRLTRQNAAGDYSPVLQNRKSAPSET